MKVELLNGKDLENRLQIMATAGMLSRANSDVFELFESRNNKKNINVVKNIIGMGHESIIEHDYLVFAIKDVSPIIEQILIGQRLASFTIKSRREVDFSNVGFYHPDFSYLENGEEISKMYEKHMEYLFNEYSKIVDLGIKKEDARFVLPYSFHSNIVMGIDGRTLEKLIEYCTCGKMSVLPELKEFGNKLIEVVNKDVPYLVDKVNKMEEHSTDNLEFIDSLVANKSYEILDNTILFDHFSGNGINMDNQIILSTLMNRYQITYDKALSILYVLSKEDKIKIIDTICNSKEQRELEQISFKYQIPISLASLTHLTRHRMHSLLIPDFLPMYNLEKHIIPPSIGKKCLDVYEDVYKNNVDKYNELKGLGVEDKDLVYFYLSGNMVNVTTNINGRTLEWISRMRCCTKAQWEIRNIANDMVREAKRKAPIFGNYLGATCDVTGICPEGKECCGKVYTLKKDGMK